MLKILAMATMLASPAASPPPAPQMPHCLSRTQVDALAAVSVAAMVETVRNACRSHLPATAWLATPAAADYSARLRGEARQRLDFAIAGLIRMAGGTILSADLARHLTEEELAEGSGGQLARYANAELCGDANEILEIGSTLSPEQTARFFGAFASLVDHGIRMAPDIMRAFPHAPARTAPVPPPPAATPTPGATPAVFDLAPRANRPAPAPATSTTPPQPFMCRNGE